MAVLSNMLIIARFDPKAKRNLIFSSIITLIMTSAELTPHLDRLPPDEKTARENKQAKDLGVSVEDIKKLNTLVTESWKNPEPKVLEELNQQFNELKDGLKTQVLEQVQAFLAGIEGDGSAKHPFQTTEQAANEVVQKAALLAQLTRAEVFVKVDNVAYVFKKRTYKLSSDRGPAVVNNYETFQLEYANILARIRGMFHSKHPEKTFGQVIKDVKSGLHSIGQETDQILSIDVWWLNLQFF